MNTSKTIPRVALVAAAAFALLSTQLVAQEVSKDAAIISQTVASQVDAYSYKANSRATIAFRGTGIAPGAKGKAEIRTQASSTAINAEFEKLKMPAELGSYTTYVLWAITPEGRANNLGTVNVKSSGRAEIEVTTPMTAFAMIVTAEPHSLVTIPSTQVVLANFAVEFDGRKQAVNTLDSRADYSTLPKQVMVKRRPLQVDQARYAVAIADAANASEFAAPAYSKATQALAAAEAAWSSKKSSERKRAPELARLAIQAGEDARVAALRGAEEKKKADAEQAAAAALADAQRAATVAMAEAGKARAAESRAQSAERTVADVRADLLAKMNAVLPTRDTSRGLVAEISGVEFATGKSTLNTSARESLARLSGVLSAFPGLSIRVEGHTDSTGTEQTNRALSNGRALAVRDYLTLNKVAASSINVEGLGASMPTADNATAEGRARNRRVEVIVAGEGITARN